MSSVCPFPPTIPGAFRLLEMADSLIFLCKVLDFPSASELGGREACLPGEIASALSPQLHLKLPAHSPALTLNLQV